MRRFVRGLALGVLVSLLVGCEPGEVGDGPALGWGDELALGAATSALSVDHEAELRFNADGNVVQVNSPIFAGGRLKVVYDPARLPNCRSSSHGLPAWAIAMFWRTLPDGEVHQEGLATSGQAQARVLEVPEDAEAIEIWFLNSDAYGCSDWDSNFEANYRFEVSQPAAVATATFGADWNESVDTPIVQGGLLGLDYAPSRLRTCRATYNGGRTWNIFATWRFLPGGQTDSAALFEGDYFAGEDAVLQPQIPVPDDATSVQLWFSNSDRAGCAAWDSDFGSNYRFDVVPPDGAAAPRVGWAGDFDFVVFHRDPATRYGDRDPAWYWDRWSGSETASWVEVQVWVPGVTDREYESEGALRTAAEGVRAEAVTDAFGGDGPGAWGTVPLEFVRKQGNNFLYSFRFWKLRYAIYHQPPIADGLHRWFARFSADGGATWFEAGRDGERTRRFAVAPDLDCALFPDHAPEECPQARAVGWAGDWGAYRSHACDWRGGLEDPVTFRKSSLGHDCMTITADVWVPGLTDAYGNPEAILAEVETDVGFSGGPLATPTTYRLGHDGRVGNNYRYRWMLGEHVGRADRGDYRFRFRFSADGGQTWTTIGTGDSAAPGGWRTLKIRNDSTDTDEVLECDGIQSWSGATATYPQCIDYAVASHADATFCELYVNAFGDGEFSHNGAWARWYEAYIRVGPVDGVVQNVGMWVHDGDDQEIVSLGNEIEPDYYLTGFTYASNSPAPGATPLDVTVDEVAFFVDVLRPAGDVVRLWQSAGGANYAPADLFAVPGFEHGIGLGTIEYADESVALFDQKRACQ